MTFTPASIVVDDPTNVTLSSTGHGDATWEVLTSLGSSACFNVQPAVTGQWNLTVPTAANRPR